jgi:hypothetical protein
MVLLVGPKDYLFTWIEHLVSILPPSQKEWITKICAGQTFLSLANFIENGNNTYDIKWAYYQNIFYDKSNDTGLIP